MTVIAFGRKKISTQKIKKQLFFQDMFYPLKTHAHYFTLLIYLATWGAAKLGIFTHFMFTNLPRRSQSISSLLHRFPAAFLALDHSRDRTSLHYRRPNKNFVLPLKWQIEQQCKNCILNIYKLQTINTSYIKIYLI